LGAGALGKPADLLIAAESDSRLAQARLCALDVIDDADGDSVGNSTLAARLRAALPEARTSGWTTSRWPTPPSMGTGERTLPESQLHRGRPRGCTKVGRIKPGESDVLGQRHARPT
jgi:hypothetical protein